MLTRLCQNHTWGCSQNSQGVGGGNGSEPGGRGAVTSASETLAGVRSSFQCRMAVADSPPPSRDLKLYLSSYETAAIF